MKIPLEFYNHLRIQIRISDIVRQTVKLTKKGAEYSGLCPFHSEKTPSFTVNDNKRFYHCFGCGAHGDAINFVSETKGLSYQESAIKIAKDNNIELPKMTKEQKVLYEKSDKIHDILSAASQFFISQLTDEVVSYLENRGINKEVMQKFLIGYAPGNKKLIKFFESKSIAIADLIEAGLVGKGDDGKIYEIFNKRIMFPISNIYSKIVGFGGRVIGDALPKYLNSPETLIFKKSEVMYGENFAISAAYKKNYSIVVEGYLDVIALHEAGFPETVASLGTAVTEKHLEKLWRAAKEIVVCLDGDAAGIRASHKLITMSLPSVGTDHLISFVQLPKGSDPDDVIKNNGNKLFQTLLNQRISLSEMIWHTEFIGKQFDSAEAKAGLEEKLNNYCLQLQDKSLAANFRRYFKDQVWNNLIRKKSNTSIKTPSSPVVSSGKNYTELAMMEHALFSFMLQYPQIINQEETRDFLLELEFMENDFNEFRDWLFDAIDNHANITHNLIKELVKNTRFDDKFLVLCDPSKLFLDQIFLNKNVENHNLVFAWLRKKYYLLHLKQEYSKLFRDDLDTDETRVLSYLNEIQKTAKELVQLNEFFIK